MTPYRLMYRLGFHPWDRTPGPEILGRVIGGPDRLPPGRALDVGCGTGRDAVYLAGRGWEVTAVDLVPRALEKARERAAGEGVEVRWVTGDAGRLGALGLEPGYTLLLDLVHAAAGPLGAPPCTGSSAHPSPETTAAPRGRYRPSRLSIDSSSRQRLRTLTIRERCTSLPHRRPRAERAAAPMSRTIPPPCPTTIAF
jgi:SAM-dependent methyltransferase